MNDEYPIWLITHCNDSKNIVVVRAENVIDAFLSLKSKAPMDDFNIVELKIPLEINCPVLLGKVEYEE